MVGAAGARKLMGREGSVRCCLVGCLALSFIGFASAECPNACSGHGTCGAKDECSCYQNYQSNDCSERTCYFGIAHVDSPKGDLNKDGIVSGPLTTVVTGSEVYPWGTTEQYPNADEHEGHFYMECSNKGICDRKAGQCDCFDGYTGTACARAACPNDCSGHGTCESIKELAEMRSYDTNAHDAPATRVAGSTNHQSYHANVEESYSYDLWDQDKTMGCKCDPGYWAADCSMRKCKYGVDPLFYDNIDGVIRQSTVIHLGSKGTNKGAISGFFKIIFYDIFGERYVTKAIDASHTTGTAFSVRLALEALPNGVISKDNPDSTAIPPAAVHVSKQQNLGTLTTLQTSGCGSCGGGSEGSSGAGLGVRGSKGTPYGPEYTITFTTNPGLLKTIAVDTEGITNPGTADYWVADVRQGQFSSRYTNNKGGVQSLNYGSKLLYTNSDWRSEVNKLVKVGGQEFLVTAATFHRLTLSEPFLGASITPTLIDTGTEVNSLGNPQTGPPATEDLTFVATAKPQTTVIASKLQSGAKLMAGNCQYTSSQASVSVGAAALTVLADHDCQADTVSAGVTLYVRSADSANQNMYTTESAASHVDTGSATQKLLGTRGSPDLYIVDTVTDSSGAQLMAKAYSTAQTKFTFAVAAGAGGTIAATTPVFVNGHGPIQATTAVANGDTTLICTGNEPASLFAQDFVNGKYPLVKGVSDTNSLVQGSVVILNGRRYKIKSRTATNGVANSKITLTENYAGSSLLELCSSCVSKVPADGLHITTTQRIKTELGDKLLVGEYAHDDLAMTVSYVASHGVNQYLSTVQKTASGTHYGEVSNPNWNAGAGAAADIDGSSVRKSLFKIANGGALGFAGVKVTEGAHSASFQYVSQCSNRGICDASSGVCQCSKGYGGDNCELQNMLAE